MWSALLVVKVRATGMNITDNAMSVCETRQITAHVVIGKRGESQDVDDNRGLVALPGFGSGRRRMGRRTEAGLASSGRVATVMDWVSQLGPVATGLVALVALVVGTLTVVQRSRADRRDQWWKRAQWAIDLTFDGQAERQKLAYRVLRVLGGSKLAGSEELRILDSLAADELQPLALGVAEHGWAERGDTGDESGQEALE